MDGIVGSTAHNLQTCIPVLDTEKLGWAVFMSLERVQCRRWSIDAGRHVKNWKGRRLDVFWDILNEQDDTALLGS